MNKLYYLLLICLVVIGGCQKAKDAECNAPDMQLSVADKQILIDLQGQPGDIYEVEYGTTGFARGSGATSTFSSQTSVTVTEYGGYDVYIRKTCANGGTSVWLGPININVDGTTTSCSAPGSLSFYTSGSYRFNWYINSANFFDVEYGPTGFTIGNGTRIRTNDQYTYDAIMHAGITYDFYVRSNCGGSAFSKWSGPQSVYANSDQNISVPCTQPTGLYAYKINSQEISYTALGHGSVSYEISISASSTTLTSNILTTSSPNGTVGNAGGFSGNRYFWVRGKCDNGSFTNWVNVQVQ